MKSAVPTSLTTREIGPYFIFIYRTNLGHGNVMFRVAVTRSINGKASLCQSKILDSEEETLAHVAWWEQIIPTLVAKHALGLSDG